MRAIRQHELGGPETLRLEEVPDPEPGPGQVRIDVRAVGVHLVDTHIRRGEFFQQPDLPTTPGREVAGVVGAVGDGVYPGLVGTRAVTHLGLAGGGYAERALAEAAAIHPTPEHLSDAEAVAAIGTGRTAAGVLMLTPMTPDDVVVVTAATGGLGALVVREAVHVGAWVLALAGGAAKLDVARTLGADALVDSRGADPVAAVEKALDGRAPTRLYDGVGGELSRGLHGLLAPGGVTTNYTGLDPDAYDDLAGPEPHRELRTLLAPDWADRFGGVPALEAEALRRAADGSRVPLVGEPFALADAAGAHRALEARRTTGKVWLDPSA